MKQTDMVYRALVDAALSGRRSWSGVSDLAWEAGVGEKLAYKALLKPAEIGAIAKHPRNGFSVTDPERIMMILSSRRSLTAARSTTLEAAQALLGATSAYALGGTRAAAHHLGGGNTIADHANAIVYVPEPTDLDRLPAGEGALVLVANERTLLGWSEGYTSPAQTYADLFAQPGWQASEFRRALWSAWFSVDDWSRADVR